VSLYHAEQLYCSRMYRFKKQQGTYVEFCTLSKKANQIML